MGKSSIIGLFVAFLALGSVACAQEFNLDDYVDESSNSLKAFDPNEWQVPENASIDELLELHDKMENKEAPDYDENVDFLAISRTVSQFGIDLSDKVLSFGDELTREQFEKAVCIKVHALLLAAESDDSATRKLNEFVNDLLVKATNEDEVLFVVKVKYLILNNIGIDKRIRNLADAALARPEPKVQSFGAAIRTRVGRVFLTKLFDMGVVDFNDDDHDFDLSYLGNDEDSPEDSLASYHDFYDSIINDSNRAQSVRETAMELNLGVFFAEARLVDADDDFDDGDSNSDGAFNENEEENSVLEKGDEFFFSCIDQDVSRDARKFFYEIWFLGGFPYYDPDETDETRDRFERVLARLRQEKDRELRDQEHYFHSHRLLEKADYLDDEATALEMDEYADKILDLIDPEDSDRVPHSVALKAKAAMIRGQYARAVDLVDDYFGKYDDTTDFCLEMLTEIKCGAVANIVKDEPAKYDDYAVYVDELLEKGDDVRASMIVAARTASVLARIADADGSLDDFNKAIETFKEDFRRCPWCYDAYADSEESIEKIGAINGKPDLYKTTAEEIIEIGENSSDRIARICASLLRLRVANDDEENGNYFDDEEDGNAFDEDEDGAREFEDGEGESVDLDDVFD